MNIEIIIYDDYSENLYFITNNERREIWTRKLSKLKVGIIVNKDFSIRSVDTRCRKSNLMHDEFAKFSKEKLKNLIKSNISINKFKL